MNVCMSVSGGRNREATHPPGSYTLINDLKKTEKQGWQLFTCVQV